MLVAGPGLQSHFLMWEGVARGSEPHYPCSDVPPWVCGGSYGWEVSILSPNSGVAGWGLYPQTRHRVCLVPTLWV